MKVRALIPLFLPPPSDKQIAVGQEIELSDWQAQQWISLKWASPVAEPKPASKSPVAKPLEDELPPPPRKTRRRKYKVTEESDLL